MQTSNSTPRKRHVLIVDDDIELAWAFKETLETCGYEATIVPDGALALKFVLGHDLDAVVCDLQMSRLDGDLLYATIERSNGASLRSSAISASFPFSLAEHACRGSRIFQKHSHCSRDGMR
jgi:CheY-like chemotaxis protein